MLNVWGRVCAPGVGKMNTNLGLSLGLNLGLKLGLHPGYGFLPWYGVSRNYAFIKPHDKQAVHILQQYKWLPVGVGSSHVQTSHNPATTYERHILTMVVDGCRPVAQR